MDQLEKLLTAQDLAVYLEVPVATVYVWRHRHQGPPGFRVGRHLRYRLGDVEQWINQRLEEHQTREPHGA
jgi:excisionase family DNA binding protein